MKSTKSMKSLRKPMSDRQIKNLANKALKNGVILTPSKGNMFLKDMAPGSKFKTRLVEGILLDVNDSAARVLITNITFGNDDDKKYYIGKQIIAPNTEVREL